MSKKKKQEVERRSNEEIVKATFKEEDAPKYIQAVQIASAMKKRLYGGTPDWDAMDIKDKTLFGWLRPDLYATESILIGRWNYLLDLEAACESSIESAKEYLVNTPIPQIRFLSIGADETREMFEDILGFAAKRGFVDGQAIEMFIQWFLHGVMHTGFEDISSIPDDINDYWYRNFRPQLLLYKPYDYLGDIIAASGMGKKIGFFPTPMPVVTLMTEMVFKKDRPYDSFNDPCIGTGRMAMVASNHCLDLHGMEISDIIHKACLVNMYLYVPYALGLSDVAKSAMNELRIANS